MSFFLSNAKSADSGHGQNEVRPARHRRWNYRLWHCVRRRASRLKCRLGRSGGLCRWNEQPFDETRTRWDCAILAKGEIRFSPRSWARAETRLLNIAPHLVDADAVYHPDQSQIGGGDVVLPDDARTAVVRPSGRRAPV